MKTPLGIASLFLLSTATFAVELDREPYLQQLSSESVVVVWRGTTTHAGTVFYGTDSANLSNEVQSSEGLQHEVLLSGLAPNTEYTYRIVSGSETLSLEPVYTFNTAPPVGDRAPFQMWIVGDSGTGGGAQYSVKEAMKAVVGSSLPDLYLHVGDMAYGDGTDSEFTSRFFLPYQELLSSIPVFTAIGNHEGHSSTSSTQSGPYFEAYVLPTQGEIGGLASGTEAYYSFDYANAHFVVLDSHQSSRKPGDAMLTWLEADLAATEQEWLVAFWHHPPYTKGSHDSDFEIQHIEMRENALPILESGGVDIVFGGHSHIYERSFLLNGAYETPSTTNGIVDPGNGDPASSGAYEKLAGTQPNGGAVYVVAGHGGTSVRGDGDHPLMAFSEVENGSVLVDVHENRLSLRNVRVDGIVTDRATLIKGEGLQVVWPNGGEVLEPGSQQEIRWEVVGSDREVEIFYSCDNGSSWVSLGEGELGSEGKDFTVPDVIGKDFLVRVDTVGTPSFSDTSDARFTVASFMDTPLFEFGSDWRYYDQVDAPGMEWLSLGFDDSGWGQGAGQFGYGDGDESTELYDAEPDNVPSAYFRKIVNVDELPDSTTVGLLFDDAAAVWVNESLLLHVNFGNGSAHEAWANPGSSDNSMQTESFDDIPWVEGENIIAVMVKQKSAESSDLSFDMTMLFSKEKTEGYSECIVPGIETGDDTVPLPEDEGCEEGCTTSRRSGVGFALFGFVLFMFRRKRG
jgi:hypothetical protein